MGPVVLYHSVCQMYKFQASLQIITVFVLYKFQASFQIITVFILKITMVTNQFFLGRKT